MRRSGATVRSIVVLGLKVAAFQPMDLCAPSDAAEVVRAVGDAEILVQVHVALAVVVAVSRTLATASSPTSHPQQRDSLVKSTIPVVVSSQYTRDIMSAYQDTLNAPIDAYSRLA